MRTVVVCLCALISPALIAPALISPVRAAPTAPAKLAVPSKAPVAARLAVSTHAPYEMRTCDVCHSSARPRSAASVKKPLTRVCFGCHGELENQTGKGKLHHGEVKGGCVSCHNPHNSPFKSLLVQNRAQLCRSCHAAPPARPRRG